MIKNQFIINFMEVTRLFNNERWLEDCLMRDKSLNDTLIKLVRF
jgi:hypothetical protein